MWAIDALCRIFVHVIATKRDSIFVAAATPQSLPVGLLPDYSAALETSAGRSCAVPAFRGRPIRTG
jgi:hypothetical protein